MSNQFQEKPTEGIAEFISKRVDEKLFFTSIIVGDDINAYKVFETLNARGVKLSTADLLKNYLFSKVYARSEGEVEMLEKMWYRMNDLLGKTDITNYIRHFWNSRNYPIERKATLFKTIKKKVATYELSIDFINALNEGVDVYMALSNPDSEIWQGEQSSYIQELNILDVSQCYPLLLAGKQKLSSEEFTKLLRDIVAITFRYNTIGGQNPNELERVYSKASVDIFTGKITTANDVYKIHLKDVYLDDTSFKNDFRTKQLNTNKYNLLARYILIKIEAQFGGSVAELMSKNVTIEHIIPENITDEWSESFGNIDIEEFVFRLGNLTLLELSKNKDAGRKLFHDKQLIYASSNFKMSQKLSEYKTWNQSSISSRQADMANKAATIWKINYS